MSYTNPEIGKYVKKDAENGIMNGKNGKPKWKAPIGRICCLTEYLSAPDQNQGMETVIKEYMMFFFDELIKGNTKLFEYDDAGSEMFIEDMAYIWYKYFADAEFEKIKPADIVKCRRYGVR